MGGTIAGRKVVLVENEKVTLLCGCSALSVFTLSEVLKRQESSFPRQCRACGYKRQKTRQVRNGGVRYE